MNLERVTVHVNITSEALSITVLVYFTTKNVHNLPPYQISYNSLVFIYYTFVVMKLITQQMLYCTQL